MVSESSVQMVKLNSFTSLNPCSCGGWSQSAKMLKSIVEIRVLILVLVEDGLRVCGRQVCEEIHRKSLNPCSCGGWSQRAKNAM